MSGARGLTPLGSGHDTAGSSPPPAPVSEAAGEAADPVAGSHLCPARALTVFGFVATLDAR
jgi:hypothetical protein